MSEVIVTQLVRKDMTARARARPLEGLREHSPNAQWFIAVENERTIAEKIAHEVLWINSTMPSVWKASALRVPTKTGFELVEAKRVAVDQALRSALTVWGEAQHGHHAPGLGPREGSLESDWRKSFLAKYEKFVEAAAQPSRTSAADGSWLSEESVDPVIKEMLGRASAETKEQARPNAIRHAEEAVLGLLTSIAEGLVNTKQGSYTLGSSTHFNSEVASALVYRVPVDFYSQTAFVVSLYKDFLTAVKANRFTNLPWMVELTDSGDAVIRPRGQTPEDRQEMDQPSVWKRARPIRFGSLKAR